MCMDFHDRVEKRFKDHVAKGWYPPVAEEIEMTRPLSFKRACVLCCIREDSDGDLYILLTVRSSNVSTHKG